MLKSVRFILNLVVIICCNGLGITITWGITQVFLYGSPYLSVHYEAEQQANKQVLNGTLYDGLVYKISPKETQPISATGISCGEFTINGIVSRLPTPIERLGRCSKLQILELAINTQEIAVTTKDPSKIVEIELESPTYFEVSYSGIKSPLWIKLALGIWGLFVIVSWIYFNVGLLDILGYKSARIFADRIVDKKIDK